MKKKKIVKHIIVTRLFDFQVDLHDYSKIEIGVSFTVPPEVYLIKEAYDHNLYYLKDKK